MAEQFGSLDDFEGILGQLEAFGTGRVAPNGPTTYRQDPKDIWHDCTENLSLDENYDEFVPARGFYPQYLRSDLISAFREYFFDIEQKRGQADAYDRFAGRIAEDAIVITFNYDVAVERALLRKGSWDIGDGYGFSLLSERPPSKSKVYKLHGSVNWFKHPVNDVPPPVMLSRDFQLLGYSNLSDPRVGGAEIAVDNLGTFIMPDPCKKFLWEEFWEPLWGKAAKALRGAEHVIIHGYSLPSADERARRLLFDNVSPEARVAVFCRGTSDRIAQEFLDRGFRRVQSSPSVGFEQWVDSVERSEIAR